MIKLAAVISVAVCFALIFCSCKKSKVSDSSGASSSKISSVIQTANLSNFDFSLTSRDISANYENSTIKTINLSSSSAVNKITSSGTYILTGSLKDSMITVDAGNSGKIQLVLDSAIITNSKGPAIYIKSANKVFITLKEGTVNTVSDGSSYALTDGGSAVDAAIFSKSDLTINGNGTINVNGSFKHAVVSKDDLVVSEATVNAVSAKDALCGKDCVKISGAKINVKAGSDGIVSSNSEADSKGFVYLASGSLNIVSANDGIQAASIVKSENATVSITAGGGSSKALNSSEESFKGIKAVSNILISGGKITVNSQDDCIHSDNIINISGGNLTLSSGDDGIHADNELAVSGGNISISKSYEGFESSKIFISGGKNSITALDDGINAAGGSDGSSVGERFGKGNFSSSTGQITISGGYTYVNASGDGIDSNGSISVSGGVTLVSGPTSNGNGAFDYDGSASVTGGTLVALGSSGMAQGFSTAENQGAIMTTFSSQAGSTSFALCDENGKAVVSFTPPKAYACVTVTSPHIKSGGTYTIVVSGKITGADANGYAANVAISSGNVLQTIKMTSSVYSAKVSGMGGGMDRGMGGRERMRP